MGQDLNKTPYPHLIIIIRNLPGLATSVGVSDHPSQVFWPLIIKVLMEILLVFEEELHKISCVVVLVLKKHVWIGLLPLQLNSNETNKTYHLRSVFIETSITLPDFLITPTHLH